MVRHLFAAKRSNEWVVSAVNRTAFRNEITLLQQLDAVFLEEPLDRARTCFVRTDMDIADALRPRGQYSICVNQRALGPRSFFR